jgi:cystathionine gamma-lyase
VDEKERLSLEEVLTMKFETQAIHAGEEPNFKEGGSGDVVVPIHLSSTFARQAVDQPTNGYEYSRTSNPTRAALEKRLATLEGAKYGLAFASGLAASTTLLLSLLGSGDSVVASDDLYGGTRRLLDEVFVKNYGMRVQYADATDSGAVEAALELHPRLVWLETPTNPLLKIADIKSIADLSHQSDSLLVVDNTFASPYLQQPLALGADVVVHSTTKFINGHSDSVGGALLVSDDALHARLRFHQNAAGAILSPFDSFLVLRGLKTLAVRMRKHEENAAKIADYLSGHPRAKKVIYPGLPSHPQHALARKQMKGFGGMVSVELNGGREEAVRFLQSLRLFALAESLGGVESLAEHPASMTHAAISPEERARLGITDSLVRLSVGIEDADDLMDDLKQALG